MSSPTDTRDPAAKQRQVAPPEVETEKPGGGSSGGGGGGGSKDKVWVITGRLRVRESVLTGTSVDRDLKGIEVKVSASDVFSADGPWWNDWGTVHTGSAGNFELRETNNGNSRYIRVQVRLVGSDLEVNDSKLDDIASLDLLDTNWRTVWQSSEQREGPDVPIGTRVFAAGSALDLGNETFRRQALIWYFLRTAVDRLKQEDAWFAMKGKFAAIYPAHPIGGLSYTNGLTRMLYLNAAGDDNDWHAETVLHEFMHLWNYDHNHGTINWLGAVCSLRGDHPVDGETHAKQENDNVAFAEGCSEWASNALRHALWGQRQALPLNRYCLTHRLGLPTLEMVQKSGEGVKSALCLLCGEANQGWWSHLFGTAENLPANRPLDSDGDYSHWEEVGVADLSKRVVPAAPNRLSLWDVLRAFRANPSKGWPTDLEVGNVEYGIVRFIDRVVEIYGLGGTVQRMLKRSIDPLATDEPGDALALRGSH